jgi:hypothetical protein
MGNEYVGLDYGYRLHCASPDELCGIHELLDSGFTAKAEVLTVDVPLADVALALDRDNVQAHAGLLDQDIFDPYTRELDQIPSLRFAHTGKESEGVSASGTIVVIVPITFSAGIAGEIGVKVDAELKTV